VPFVMGILKKNELRVRVLMICRFIRCLRFCCVCVVVGVGDANDSWECICELFWTNIVDNNKLACV